MKKTLLVALGWMAAFCSYAQITIFEQNSKYGLKDASGSVVVSAEFDHISVYNGYNYYTDPAAELFVGNKGGKVTTQTVIDTTWGYTDDYYTYQVTGTKERKHEVITGGTFFLFNASGQQINADGFENVALKFASPANYGYEPYYNAHKTLDDTGNPKETDRNLIQVGSNIMVKKNGKWGLMNLEPRYVIPCVSDGLIEEMTGDQAVAFYLVKKGKSVVLYNMEGKPVGGEYDKIEYFNTWENYSDITKSVARVIKAGKIGYINMEGKEIIPPKYEYLVKVTSDIYIFNKGGKLHRYEWLDSSAFYYNYDYYDPSENYTPQVVVVKDSLMKGGKFGVIKDGKEIIPASYSFIEYDPATMYFFGHSGGEEPTNPKGSQQNYDYYGYGEYDYGYSNSYEYTHYQNVERPTGSKRSVIDNTGKVRLKDVEGISLNYINMSTRQVDENGLYTNVATYYHLITRGEKSGLINSDFKEVIPVKFKTFTYNPNIENGSIIVGDDNNKFGLYSVTTGKALTGMDYAQIINGDKFYYYNKGGKWTKQMQSYYDYYTDSTYSYEVENLVGGKYGIIKANNEDMGALYDTIYVLGYKNSYNYNYYEYGGDYGSSKPIVTFKKNGMMGIFGSTGSEAIPAQFSSITYDYSSGKLNIMNNNLYGLASLNGKMLIDPQYTSLYAVGYSYYGGQAAAYVATNTENLQGIIDTTGNILFDFKFNWVDSYNWNQNAEVIKVSKGNLYGYADRSGNEILPCEYEEINDYFNYTSKISIVKKDGKKGLYDRSTGTMITAPKYSDVLLYEDKINGLTKVLMGGEIYWDSTYYTNRVRGGKVGYVDSIGREIIPALYDNVSFNNEVELYMGNKGKFRDYYDINGKKITDGENRWKNSYLGRKMMENQKIVALNWSSANGPVGADATAFYYDEDGTYWLGTGSSGGVYRSKDQGKSWTETNNGIGPRHIIFMGKMYDTLFIVDQGAGSYSNYEMYSGEFGYFESVHFWNENSQSWDLIPESRKYTVANDLYTASNTLKYQQDQPQGVAGYGANTNYFPTHIQNMYYYGSPISYIGKYNVSTYGYDTIAADGMPKDCYPNAAGNIFAVENNNYILLAKSGIFKFYGSGDNSNIVQLNEKGLKASDITQIGSLPNGAVIVREGTSDIWKYEGNTWTKLLDAYAMNLELGESANGYYTGNFSIDTRGNILVPFRGSIYEFSADGNMKIVAKAGSISDFTEYSPNGYSKIEFLQAVRDKNNRTWVLANANGYYSNNYGLLEIKDGKVMYADTAFTNSYNVPYLFTDKKGNAWKYMDYVLSMVGNEEKTRFKSNYYDFDVNKIAFGNSGEIALVNSYSTLAIFVPEKSKWIEVSLSGANSITAMNYDNSGNLMVATNYEFEYFCGSDQKIKKAEPFIGYLEFSMDGIKLKSLNNPVNPRVLSLYQHPTMGLLVGTSGSGLQITTKR